MRLGAIYHIHVTVKQSLWQNLAAKFAWLQQTKVSVTKVTKKFQCLIFLQILTSNDPMSVIYGRNQIQLSLALPDFLVYFCLYFLILYLYNLLRTKLIYISCFQRMILLLLVCHFWNQL